MFKAASFAILATIILTTTGPAYSKIKDVKSVNYAIATTKIEDKWIFGFCELKSKKPVCSPIGKKTGYTEQELMRIGKDEKFEAEWKTGVAVVGSVAALAATIYLAPAAGTFFVYSLFAGTQPLTVLIPTVAGITAVGTGAYWFNKTNPWHQFSQANVLKTEGLLTSKDVSTSDKKVLEIKHLLEEILPIEPSSHKIE